MSAPEAAPMEADLMQRWEQLQAQTTAVRREWLHCADPAEKAQLQQQLQHLQQQSEQLEIALQGTRAAAKPVRWPLPMRVLFGLVLLPVLIAFVLVGKHWLSERELARFFQQNPPLAIVTVTAGQPMTVLDIELALSVEWVGRLALATLSLRPHSGEIMTQAILGGEVLLLPGTAEQPLYLHVQAIDYQAESVQVQIFQSVQEVTSMR